MTISIIDYGLSNLLSVCRAVEVLGHEPQLIHTADKVYEANIIILPGVGAFADGMAGLENRGLVEPIRESVHRNIPILGICLGMQMLFYCSYEFGHHTGLCLIPGEVKRINDQNDTDKSLKIPHISWEGLLPPQNERSGFCNTSILRNTNPGDEVYFIHSYVAFPKHKEHILAECEYDNHRLCAVVGKDNVFGTQFHPEKSGPVGLKILDAFISLAI